MIRGFFEFLDMIFKPLVNSWAYWIIVIVSAVIFTIMLRGVQFRKVKHMAKNTFMRPEGQSNEGISPFMSAMLAIGGRVGPGNVVGVTIAIFVGGPGALLWFWLIALFGTALAYAEAVLGQVFKTRDDDGNFVGGPAFYMKSGIALTYPDKPKLVKSGRVMSNVYAIISLIAFSTFLPAIFGSYVIEGAGNAINNEFTFTSMSTLEWGVTAIVALFTFALLLKGINTIIKLSGRLVPVMAAAFFAIALFILFTNLTEIPGFFSAVFGNALDQDKIVGGAAGGGVSIVISRGITRGLFATESGTGTGSIAGASADVDHPARVAYSQSFAIFFVITIATLTGFVIYISGLWHNPDGSVVGNGGILDTSHAFGDATFGRTFGGKFVPLTVMFFAFTSLVAVSAYSLSQTRFVLRNKSERARRIGVMITKIVVTSFIGIAPIMVTVADNPFAFADFAIMVQILVNLVTIFLLLPVITKVSRDFEKKTKDKWSRRVVFDPNEVGVKASHVWYEEKAKIIEEETK